MYVRIYSILLNMYVHMMNNLLHGCIIGRQVSAYSLRGEWCKDLDLYKAFDNVKHCLHSIIIRTSYLYGYSNHLGCKYVMCSVIVPCINLLLCCKYVVL